MSLQTHRVNNSRKSRRSTQIISNLMMPKQKNAPDRGEGQTKETMHIRLVSLQLCKQTSKTADTTIFSLCTRHETRPTHLGTNMNLNSPPRHHVISKAVICMYLFFTLFVALSHQQQQLCPTVCTCEDTELKVSCNGHFEASGLPHTLNPTTKRMYIHNAQTIKFTRADLQLYPNLEVLDLAFNKLTAFESDQLSANLVSMNASHNGILEFKDSAVGAVLSRLTSVMGPNTQPDVESDEFKKLRKSKINIVELDLSYNQLTTLKNFVFIRWHKLQRLDMSYNSIEVLEDDSFFGLTKLEHINLKGNRLTKVPSSTLQCTTKSPSYIISSSEQTPSALKTINLSENPIVSIGSEAFKSLGQVQNIYLDSCLIKTIDEQAFEGLTSIITLSMTNNHLTEIPSKTLNSLSTLKTLKINLNDIYYVRSYAFKNLYNLEDLQITNGSLCEVEAQGFYGLSSLKNLQLSYNPNLTKIDLNIFEELPKLTRLDLQMGSLMSLTATETIADHPLKVLDLRGNSLSCNCDLKWVTNLLKRLNETAISVQQNKSTDAQLDSHTRSLLYDTTLTSELLNITCAGPPALAGKQIIALPDNKLECIKPSSDLNVKIGFASLFFMIFILTTVCLINFCREEKHLMGILKENIVQNRISTMMLPYTQDINKKADNFKKETQLECADYEPVDYGPIYTIPADQYMNSSQAEQHTHRV